MTISGINFLRVNEVGLKRRHGRQMRRWMHNRSANLCCFQSRRRGTLVEALEFREVIIGRVVAAAEKVSGAVAVRLTQNTYAALNSA